MRHPHETPWPDRIASLRSAIGRSVRLGLARVIRLFAPPLTDDRHSHTRASASVRARARLRLPSPPLHLLE
jgi:hypothetical protein